MADAVLMVPAENLKQGQHILLNRKNFEHNVPILNNYDHVVPIMRREKKFIRFKIIKDPQIVRTRIWMTIKPISSSNKQLFTEHDLKKGLEKRFNLNTQVPLLFRPSTP